MAKRKTTKKAKPKTLPPKKPVSLRRHRKAPRISTGNAKKQVAEDFVNLALLVCDTLEAKGAERGKLAMILPTEMVEELKLQDGDHFSYTGGSCLCIPIHLHPVKLVELARKLHLLREAPDQAEGTYFRLHEIAWVHLHPELL